MSMNSPAEKKPSHEEIVTGIRDLFASQLGMEFAEVTLDKNLVEDLGADSLDLVELAMAVEETFDIEIPDEEWEKMGDASVERVIHLVEEKINAS
jgi:acyl carrier protein